MDLWAFDCVAKLEDWSTEMLLMVAVLSIHLFRMETDHILNANDADHSRIRKLFAHSFSEKALAEQEVLVQSYVDVLIKQLRKQTDLNESSVVDLSTWSGFTAFAIIGGLGFGEAFDCLEDPKYHAWVGMPVGQFETLQPA